MSRSAAPLWTRTHSLLALAVLGLGLFLRLHRLGEQPLWSDEALFFLRSNTPGGWLACLLHSLADDVYPPFFFLLLHGLGALSADLFWLRLPGALAGVLAVAVFMGLLRRLGSPRAALLGGGLAACSPLLIHYSQELKMYPFLALWLLLLFSETLRCLEDPERGWGRLALWALLSVYTFYLSLIVWACLLAAAWWAHRREPQRLRPLARAYGAASLLFLPWLPIFLKSIVQNQGSTQNLLMGRALLYSLQNFSVGFWAPLGLAWAGLGLYAALAWRGQAALRARPARRGLLLAFAFLPLTLSLLISLASKPMYSDRAMLACAFAWLGLAALGWDSLPRLLRWLVLPLLLLPNLWLLRAREADPACRLPDPRPAWEHVVRHWQPGDAVFHGQIDTYEPFAFFAWQEARRPDRGAYRESWPGSLPPGSSRAAGLRPNWMNEEPPAYPAGAASGFIRRIWRAFNAWLSARGLGIYTGYNRDIVAGERLEREALPGVQRIWYLGGLPESHRRLWMPQLNVYRAAYNGWRPLELEKKDWLNGHFQLVTRQALAETDISLYQRRPSAGERR